MGLIGHLVAKDLKRKRRSPLGLIAALAFPLLFSGLIALAFGRGGGIPKVRMLVANEDDGLLAGFVASAFTSQQASAYFDAKTVERDAGVAMIDQGQASALLTIPKGFTNDVLDGKRVTLTLLENPSEGILPQIAEQTAGAIADVLDGGRRVFDGPISQLTPLLKDGRSPADADIVAISLAVKRGIEGLSGIVNPPVIALDSEMFGGPKPESKGGGDAPGTIFLVVLPGVAVYGLFLVADQGMRDVMTERTLGTLRRQLAGPVKPGTVILAKAAFTGVLAAGAILVMATVGGLVLNASVSLVGFLLVSAALVLAVTGTSAAIYGLARTERQAATLGNMIFLLMGFMGGGFIRVDSLPPSLRGIAPLTPLYWATQGYRTLLGKGAGAADVLRHTSILATMGVVLLLVGVRALHGAAKSGARA